MIPTFNRAAMLEWSLESLARQTLSPSEYEVIVVNDGSTDTTADVVGQFSSRLNVRFTSIANSGISAAKNLGLFLSEAPITLFFDDDDVADSGLLRSHLDAHDLFPNENFAVLGFTTWDSRVEITAVMEYVTEVGQFLFSYPTITDGQVLDYTYFWGGRSSCKRRFLAQHGVFNQDFRAIIEDIELAYRLSKHGLRVVHKRAAASFMVRAVTFDDFCMRCQRQGDALRRFSMLHSDPEVQNYCRVAGAVGQWAEVGPRIPSIVSRVHELEAALASGSDGVRDALLPELHDLYRRSFEAFRLKGVVGRNVMAAPLGAPVSTTFGDAAK